MALNWNWEDKIGHCVYVNAKGEEYRTNIYLCNGLMVECYHYEENGKELYNVYNFWINKEHAQRCLGISGDHKGNNLHDCTKWVFTRNIEDFSGDYKKDYKTILKLLIDSNMAFEYLPIEGGK